VDFGIFSKSAFYVMIKGRYIRSGGVRIKSSDILMTLPDNEERFFRCARCLLQLD